MKDENKVSADDDVRANRRRFLAAAAGLGALGGAAALGRAAPAVAAEAPAGEPLIDKWLRTGVVKVGAQMTQPPMSFIDDKTSEPTGFLPTLFTRAIKDLKSDLKIEWTNMPFGQLIPAWLAGQFDMLGQSLSATPARALRGWFTTVPVMFSSGVVVVRKDGPVKNYDQLNSPDVTFAVLQGGIEASKSASLYPKAKIKEFPSAGDAGTEVSLGRATAMTMSAHNVPSVIQPHPNLAVLPGEPIYVSGSAWMLPVGDLKTLVWLNNWLTQASIESTLVEEWSRWFAPALAPFNMTASASGPMGMPYPVDTVAYVKR